MKLPNDATIAREKIDHYLLMKRSRNDKSAFLAKGGYSLIDPDALLFALAKLQEEGEAQYLGSKRHGHFYEVIGILPGTSGICLQVRTIWMTEHLSGITKFITLIPVGILNS